MNDPKLTITDFEAIRREMLSGLVSEHDFDDIDHECEIDPLLLDRPPGHRSESDISRLDAIFNELERRDG